MRCCIFLCRRNVPPSLAHCDREKEKSVEFANGSLLRSDSRIFVQHPGVFPLFRTRFSRFLLPLPPLSSSHRSFRSFLFFKVLLSRDTGVLHPPHFLLCSFLVLSLAVSPLDASYFLFRILNFSFPYIAQVFTVIAYLFWSSCHSMLGSLSSLRYLHFFFSAISLPFFIAVFRTVSLGIVCFLVPFRPPIVR